MKKKPVTKQPVTEPVTETTYTSLVKLTATGHSYHTVQSEKDGIITYQDDKTIKTVKRSDLGAILQGQILFNAFTFNSPLQARRIKERQEELKNLEIVPAEIIIDSGSGAPVFNEPKPTGIVLNPGKLF